MLLSGMSSLATPLFCIVQYLWWHIVPYALRLRMICIVAYFVTAGNFPKMPSYVYSGLLWQVSLATIFSVCMLRCTLPYALRLRMVCIVAQFCMVGRSFVACLWPLACRCLAYFYALLASMPCLLLCLLAWFAF